MTRVGLELKRDDLLFRGDNDGGGAFKVKSRRRKYGYDGWSGWMVSSRAAAAVARAGVSG